MIRKIKIAGIYKIEHISGRYYIGQSVDIFTRWQSHYTGIKLKKHSSPLLIDLWETSSPTEFSFSILEVHSKTKHKETTNLKGKALESSFKQLLLKSEKEWFKRHSITLALNKNNKHFGE